MRAWTIAGFFDRRSVTAASVAAAALAIAFAPLAGRAQREASGSWRIQYVEDDNQVQLSFDNFDARGHSSTGSQVPLSALEGLSASQLRGSPSDAHFRLKRDAGTFNFDSRVGNNRGSGQFEFTADPRFAAGLAQLGYRLGDSETLVDLRDHGVTPAFISGLSQLGYVKLRSERLQELRDHGVTPSYISGMHDAGYRNLGADDLLTARDHGVTAEFAVGFRKLGYASISLTQLVRLRDHGVTPEFAAKVRARDGSMLSVQELISRRDSGEKY